MDREQIIQSINNRFREISTETIMFHQTVADIIGLHITDHKSLELIYRYGPMPAGKLADLTGFTTGAVTGIIDRLEKAGYVKRVNDPADRRKIIVEPTRDKELEKKLQAIFTPLALRMHNLLSGYSDEELMFLFDILTKCLEESRDELLKLRVQSK